ncbi:hypothetical protein D3C76_1869090 [compost metagenome]
MRGHFFGIARHDNLVGTQLLRRLALGFRSGERHYIGAHRVGQLNAHVTQTTDADHANFLTRPGVPVT